MQYLAKIIEPINPIITNSINWSINYYDNNSGVNT